MSIHVHAVEDSFDSMSRQINDIIGEMSKRSYFRFSRNVAWEPSVNILEDDHHLYFCVELAGMSQDATVVEVVENKLRIRGDRPVPRPPGSESTGCIMHMEINSGSFERLIELPDRADPAIIDARLESGFLWITVDKRNP